MRPLQLTELRDKADLGVMTTKGYSKTGALLHDAVEYHTLDISFGRGHFTLQ